MPQMSKNILEHFNKINLFKKFKNYNKSVVSIFVSKIYSGNDLSFGFIITADKRLWAFGDNSLGQLGLGHNHRVDSPHKIDFNGKEIVNIIKGCNRMYAITSENEIFEWGTRICQVFNPREIQSNYSVPKMIFPFKMENGRYVNESIKMIWSANIHSLALTKNGHVYAWGYNNFGQCNGSTLKILERPTIIDFTDELIDQIYCYANSSFAITKSKKVIFWGQFGWGVSKSDTEEFRILCPELEISQLVCTSNFIYMINDGDLLRFREDKYENTFISDVTNVLLFEQQILVQITTGITSKVYRIVEVLDEDGNFERNQVFKTNYESFEQYLFFKHDICLNMFNLTTKQFYNPNNQEDYEPISKKRKLQNGWALT